MRGLLTLGAAASAGLLCGFSAQDAGDRSFNYGSNGREAEYFYHHVSGDCETIDHGHGRNHAWGRWLMPVDQVEVVTVSDHRVGFRCRDGSACIAKGHLSQTPERIDYHEVPFETAEMSRGFADRVARLQATCAAD